MELLLKLLEFLTPYGIYSYIVMYGILIGCGFGFPMPEDIVLISGGILASRGITDLWVVNAVCMAGVLMGDGVVFFLGRKYGPAIKSKRLFKRVLNEKSDRRVMTIFSKYGDKVIFIGRFMPGLRMPLFMTAGIYQVPPLKFFLLDGFAAIISVPVWIYVGYVFGSNIEKLAEKVEQLQFGIYGALAIAIIFIVVSILVKKKTIRRLESPP